MIVIATRSTKRRYHMLVNNNFTVLELMTEGTKIGAVTHKIYVSVIAYVGSIFSVAASDVRI